MFKEKNSSTDISIFLKKGSQDDSTCPHQVSINPGQHHENFPRFRIHMPGHAYAHPHYRTQDNKAYGNYPNNYNIGVFLFTFIHRLSSESTLIYNSLTPKVRVFS